MDDIRLPRTVADLAEDGPPGWELHRAVVELHGCADALQALLNRPADSPGLGAVAREVLAEAVRDLRRHEAEVGALVPEPQVPPRSGQPWG